MADFSPPPDPTRAPADQRRRLLAGVPRPTIAPPALDPAPGYDEGLDMTVPWNSDDGLRLELQRLQAAINGAGPPAAPAYPAESVDAGYAPAEDLIGDAGAGEGLDYPGLHSAPAPRRAAGRPTPLPVDLPAFDLRAGPAADAELDRLRSENEALRKIIDDTKQILEEASSQEQNFQKTLADVAAREKDLQQQIQERDDQVKVLTGQIHELEQHITQMETSVKKPLPSEEEMAKMVDELEKDQAKLGRERQELEQERQQLREDEGEMMKQMREMEVSMAKERADMARQRTDLQRLHEEIHRELETLQRADGGLSNRLAQFQRRHQEVINRGGSGSHPLPPAAAIKAPPAVPNAPAPPPNGVMRRLFGKG